MRGAELKKLPAPSQSCRTQSKLSFDKSNFPIVFLVISTWKMHQSPGFLVQCFEHGYCPFTPEKFCVWLAGLWCRGFLAAPRTVILCQPPFSDSAVPSIKHGQQHSQCFHALIWSLLTASSLTLEELYRFTPAEILPWKVFDFFFQFRGWRTQLCLKLKVRVTSWLCKSRLLVRCPSQRGKSKLFWHNPMLCVSCTKQDLIEWDASQLQWEKRKSSLSSRRESSQQL